MLLLARVAEQLYWAARYVERAEMTARVVSEHTHLLVDLPTSVPLTWEPLLDVPGARPPAGPERRPSAGDDGHGDGDGPGPPGTIVTDVTGAPQTPRRPGADGTPGADPADTAHPAEVTEREVVAFLLAAPDNPSSVLASVSTARANLRSTREVLSREAWEALNSLYLFVTSNHGEGVDRWSRGRFLDRVIAEAQRFNGILAGTMTRGAPYQFLRLGRSLERADMTNRVLDARAVPLLDSPAGSHVEVQWSALLRSLSALPAYYQRGLAPVAGPPAIGLVLHDPDFPGSIGHCLGEASAVLAELPRSTSAATAVGAARRTLADVVAEPAARLHDGLLALRSATAAVHDEVESTFFPPPDPPGPDRPADTPTPAPAPSPSQSQTHSQSQSQSQSRSPNQTPSRSRSPNQTPSQSQTQAQSQTPSRTRRPSDPTPPAPSRSE